MPVSFIIPTVTVAIEDANPAIIGGEDIAIQGADFNETDAGDWATVSGVTAAFQSVVREIPAATGSFPRRPRWGAGVGPLLFQGATKASRDLAVSQATANLHRNRRIKNVLEVSARPPDSSSGIVLTIRADAVDGPITAQIESKARLP